MKLYQEIWNGKEWNRFFLSQIHRSDLSSHKHAWWLSSSVQCIHFYHLPVLYQASEKNIPSLPTSLYHEMPKYSISILNKLLNKTQASIIKIILNYFSAFYLQLYRGSNQHGSYCNWLTLFIFDEPKHKWVGLSVSLMVWWHQNGNSEGMESELGQL